MQSGRQVGERVESCFAQLPGRGERHEGPRCRGEVIERADGLGGVPVDEGDGYSVPVDGVPRAEVGVGDDFAARRGLRAEAVAGDGRLEACRGFVQCADQPGRAAQGRFGPGIGREPVPAARVPPRVVGDIAIDEGQDFPIALHPQQPGGAAEPGCLQVPQVLVHGRRPRPHRPQQLVTAPHHPGGHPPAANRHLAIARTLVAGHDTSIAAEDA